MTGTVREKIAIVRIPHILNGKTQRRLKQERGMQQLSVICYGREGFMPEIKFFEVRDRMTFVPVMAICFDPNKIERESQDEYLLSCSGYNWRYVLYAPLDGYNHGKINYDSVVWQGDYTHPIAHKYIETHWDELESGDVVDCEFIRGESKWPKTTQRKQ